MSTRVPLPTCEYNHIRRCEIWFCFEFSTITSAFQICTESTAGILAQPPHHVLRHWRLFVVLVNLRDALVLGLALVDYCQTQNLISSRCSTPATAYGTKLVMYANTERGASTGKLGYFGPRSGPSEHLTNTLDRLYFSNAIEWCNSCPAIGKLSFLTRFADLRAFQASSSFGLNILATAGTGNLLFGPVRCIFRIFGRLIEAWRCRHLWLVRTPNRESFPRPRGTLG